MTPPSRSSNALLARTERGEWDVDTAGSAPTRARRRMLVLQSRHERTHYQARRDRLCWMGVVSGSVCEHESGRALGGFIVPIYEVVAEALPEAYLDEEEWDALFRTGLAGRSAPPRCALSSLVWPNTCRHRCEGS